MQRKRRIKQINRLRRKKPLVEGPRNSGAEVKAAAIGSEALFHGGSAKRRNELKEGVEVTSEKKAENSGDSHPAAS